MVEIVKYQGDMLKTNNEIIQEISSLIKETFKEIAELYSEDSVFRKEVEGNLEETIKKSDNGDVFYLIKGAKNEIIACLRGLVNEEFLNKDMGEGNSFFSKYLGVRKIDRRKGLGSLLKAEFEKDAIKKTQDSQKPTIVISRVHKSNESSKEWNQANGYEERDEGKTSVYLQYYKDFYPENFKKEAIKGTETVWKME